MLGALVSGALVSTGGLAWAVVPAGAVPVLVAVGCLQTARAAASPG